MSTFDRLQAEHEALLARQRAGENILGDVRAYVQQARNQAGEIASLQQRGQLRANLRYWAGYVYEATGSYPSTDLVPASDEAPLPGETTTTTPAVPAWLLWAGGAALLFILLLALLFWQGLQRPLADGEVAFPATETPSPLLADTATATREISGEIPDETADEETEGPATAMLTPSPSPPARATATATFAPTPTPNLFATSITDPNFPTPEAATTTPRGFFVGLSNVRDGSEVAGSTVVLEGFYRNLRPGWTIHVIWQPLSAGGRFFVAPNAAAVGQSGSGEWKVELALGRQLANLGSDQVNVYLVVATDDETRRLLAAGGERRLEEIVENALLFPEITTLFYRTE